MKCCGLFQGGYMAAKKSKLQEQFSEDAAKEGGSHSKAGSNIFQGIAIFVNGYTGMTSAAWLCSWLEHTSNLASILEKNLYQDTLPEAYGKVCSCKHLSGMFPVQNGLKY
jgi:hypothetical protein